MEKITLNGLEHTINYQETKIGDTIFDKNSNSTYTADISDADDLNWIIIETIKLSK